MFSESNRGGDADKAKFHPTQKPISLYMYCIRQFAKQGDRILDTHLGSGSSRIAAFKLGFDFIGCEINKDYYDKSVERFNRECLGEYTLKDGRKVKQLDLFK
jgi:site-specific DNA-methyltransferase (adenine-specific)